MSGHRPDRSGNKRDGDHPSWAHVHTKPVGLVFMFLLVLLATGIFNEDGTAPAAVYLDEALRDQVRADEQLSPIADPVPPADAVPQAPTKKASSRPPREDKPYRMDYRALALRIAKEEQMRHPELFVRQIAAESGMQPCVVSGAGAVGIAQIMPTTAASWRVDPYIPEWALRTAAQNMNRYFNQYGDIRLALAAYNAGPGAVAMYGGVPPYTETRNYVAKIMDRSYPLPGMRQVFILPKGFSTGFNKGIRGLIREVRANGGEIRIVDGWRSYDEQLRLWVKAKKQHGGWQAAKRWVAPPGCSNHNRGWAADLEGDLEMAQRLAPKHGLVFPMAHEPWHVELAGIPTQSG